VAANKIVFDVGGQRFATSKASLLRIKGTYFEGLVASGKWKPDADGVYFIDRDPTHFGRILNYLRDPDNFNLFRGIEDRDELKRELDYFLIPLPTNPRWKALSASLKVDDLAGTLTKTGANGWNTCAVSEQPVKSKVVFRIINRGPSGNIKLGLAPRGQFQQNYNMGWFVQVSNGSLYTPIGSANNSAGIINSGSLITLLVDLGSSSIRILIDGQNRGAYFSGIISSEAIHAAIDIYDQSASVELCELQ